MAQISPNPNTGRLTVSGSDSNNEVFSNLISGIIDILATGNLTNDGTLINDDTIINDGTLNNNSLLTNNRVLFSDGTLNNNGTITNNDNLFNAFNGTLNNNGTITSFGTLETENTLNNNGTINNSGALRNGDTLNNNFSGTINNSNNGTINNVRQLRNDGTINNDGTLNNDDIINNSRTITNGGTLTNNDNLINGGTLTNTNNSTLTNNGILSNFGFLTNNGTLTNFGTLNSVIILTNNNTLNNNGTLNSDFILTNNNTLNNNGILTNNNTLTNNGILTNTSSGSFVNNGTIAGVGRFVGALSGGTVDPGNTADPHATFTVDGTYTLGRLNISFNGTDAGDFDVLSITGAANLPSGTINFNFDEEGLKNDIAEGETESIAFLTSGSLSNALNLASLTPTDDGDNGADFDFVLRQDGTNLVLDITRRSSNNFLVTNTNDSGVGSLRWAIENANTTSGSQTIEFARSLSGQTININGIFQITDSGNIDGDIDNNGTADIRINAGGGSQLFNISANQTVTIEGMVLSAGQGNGFGGISNSGNLTLLNSTVVDNNDFGNAGLGGGGIFNSGTNSVLTLVGSTVTSNATNKRGGGIYNNGGQVTITNSHIDFNFADLDSGGGLYNNGGTVIVNNSTIDRNSSNVGAGLVNDNGTTTLNSSTLLNNTATDTVSSAINNKGNVLGLGSVVTLNASTVSGGVYGNTFNSGLLVITGTNSGETLQGSSGVDQISGSGGNDLLQGYQGNDTLIGGDGNDVVNGGDNNDLLQGGAGNDRLGGLGGTDQMEGGTGNDTYTVNNAAATLIEAAGEGTDTIRSQISWSLDDNFENLTLLGAGNLNGTGNDIINALTGNRGNNVLDGKSSNDRLIGNDGDDVLIGGVGIDTVTGGNGNDRFVFNAVNEGGDRITDFVTGNDKIQISAGGFGAGLSVGILAESQFAIGTMTTTDQRFLYDTATGSLFFDSNGSAADGRTRIATLTAQPSISANDIVIVV